VRKDPKGVLCGLPLPVRPRVALARVLSAPLLSPPRSDDPAPSLIVVENQLRRSCTFPPPLRLASSLSPPPLHPPLPKSYLNPDHLLIGCPPGPLSCLPGDGLRNLFVFLAVCLVSVSVCLAVRLTCCPSLLLSVGLAVCLSCCLCLAVRMSCCPYVLLSVCFAIRLFCYPSVLLSVCFAIHLFCCPHVLLSVCLAVHLSCCPSVLLSICLAVCMSCCPYNLLSV